MRVLRFLWMIAMTTAISATLSVAQTAAAKQLRLGTDAANSGNYRQAAQHFQNAVRLEPQSLLARLHLANAYAQEYLTGPKSAHSTELARRTTEAFEAALRLAPDNKLALWDLAVFPFASGDLEHGRQLSQKLIHADPNNARAHYLLGVIDWAISFRAYRKTLTEAGLKPPQFISNAGLREKFKSAQLPVIDEGLQATQRALALDSGFGQAMVFESMLLREKAATAENEENYRSITAQADALLPKARAAMEKTSPKPSRAKLDPEAPPPPLHAPPPPPPPPPPPARPTSG